MSCGKHRIQLFISPEYVAVAFDLRGTFWRFMEKEIEKCAVEDGRPVFTHDVEDALTFLAHFFSTAVVDTIRAYMESLRTSYLGIQYALRPGKAVLARNVLHDVQMKCDLHGFLGHSYCDSDVIGSPLHGFLGHSCDSDIDADVDEIHFEAMHRETVVVPMSSHHQTLKARSWEFVSHSLVGDHSEKLYNPAASTCESGLVSLFHGTQKTHLDSFQRRGIAPPFNRNEFSMDTAFYVSNSIRLTFEHPLHYHPSTSATDTIVVFLFEVDVRVLHGLEPPPGELTPLTNLGFADIQQNFCNDNFMLAGSKHSYDIVIGPVCLPQHERLPGNAPFTQIAFCSKRARSWLESCFKRVFVETRAT